MWNQAATDVSQRSVAQLRDLPGLQSFCRASETLANAERLFGNPRLTKLLRHIGREYPGICLGMLP
jgi:hypothetical protein